MSRTYRSTEHKWYRRPKTMNEKAQLNGFLHDPDIVDRPVSGINHAKKRKTHLPSSWDDISISAGYEIDHKGFSYD